MGKCESYMPISCANCIHSYGGYCNLTNKDIEDELLRRNKDCPLSKKINLLKAEYIDRTKLKEDSEYNPVSGEYLSYSRGQIWNAHVEKVIDISVLDKIRAEIEELKPNNPNFKGYFEQNVALNKVLKIIDKYKADRSVEDGSSKIRSCNG